MEGKRDQALESLNDRVREVDEPQGVYLSRLVAGLFFIHHLSGNLVRARTEAQRLRTVAEKSGIVYTLAWSEFMEACTYLHAHDLEPALKHMDLAVRQRYILHTRAAVDALAGLALTQQLLGRQDEAAATLDMLQSFTLELGEAQYLAVADACRSRLALLRGDLAPALDWARSTDEAPTPSGLFMWLEVPPVTRARVLITDGSRASVETAVEILDADQRPGRGLPVREPGHRGRRAAGLGPGPPGSG